MPVVKLLENAKVVINWYGLYVEGSTPTKIYYITNVASIKRLVFKIYIRGLESCILGTCESRDQIMGDGDTTFKIVVNDKYTAEHKQTIIHVGDVYEIDATSTILPYLTDGYMTVKLIIGMIFVSPTHPGYHIYVDLEMSYELKEGVAPEHEPKINPLGYTLTPSEIAGLILGSLLPIIQPFLPLIIMFTIFYLAIKIIF